SILAINAWELLLKAKWLADNGNKLRSIYVLEPRAKADGTRAKKLKIKTTRSGNALTYGIEFLAKKLVEKGTLDQSAWGNIQALLELRDSAIHFYNRSGNFSVRIQELGTACIKNFAAATAEWFKRDLSEFNFYLMPLSFVTLPTKTEALILNSEEKKFLTFVDSLEPQPDNPEARYSVTVNIEVRFTRSKAKEALAVQITNDPSAPRVRLTEEQIRERHPWDYERLTKECVKRYSNFKVTQKYHETRKKLLLDNDKRFGDIRFLDPGNPKSSRKAFYNPNILVELDRLYEKARTVATR
ncbi:MAG: DUF3644 domain-containing protein, partial [Nitrososphaera sp.]|nr:DUF3644 domain-containing protein [Nitrososphaera sp.]